MPSTLPKRERRQTVFYTPVWEEPKPRVKKAPVKMCWVALRELLWTTTFQDSLKGECYCCAGYIDVGHWQAGHIIARKNGGPDTLENLRPVCKTCNCRMGTENLEDYKTRVFG
jgi:5-methylcytosine-specific restriction endonuclease McrA